MLDYTWERDIDGVKFWYTFSNETDLKKSMEIGSIKGVLIESKSQHSLEQAFF